MRLHASSAVTRRCGMLLYLEAPSAFMLLVQKLFATKPNGLHGNWLRPIISNHCIGPVT